MPDDGHSGISRMDDNDDAVTDEPVKEFYNNNVDYINDYDLLEYEENTAMKATRTPATIPIEMTGLCLSRRLSEIREIGCRLEPIERELYCNTEIF